MKGEWWVASMMQALSIFVLVIGFSWASDALAKISAEDGIVRINQLEPGR